MTARGKELHATADRQIAELIGLVSTMDEATLRRPCPGREKLGDGTVGASARHAADNYERIAAFVQASDRMSSAHRPAQRGGHHIPRFLRAMGHGPADHSEHGAGGREHHDQYTADTVDVDVVVGQLSAARGTLRRIGKLMDRQLDAIPPKDSFRFCDGQRTLEQVLAGLLKHQRHQIDALTVVEPRRSARD
jgi:hypothetical protein